MRFSYFRHTVNARQDDKINEFSRLLGRKSKEAYFYYFTLLEYCSSISDEDQTEFKIHLNTLRNLWESNAKGVNHIIDLMAQSGLVSRKLCANCAQTLCKLSANFVQTSRKLSANLAQTLCKPCTNLVIFDIPNLPIYLGSYETNKNKEKQRKEKKIKPNKTSDTPEKKSSPLSKLFDPDDEIQKWLLTGTDQAQEDLLKNYSEQDICEQVRSAYLWQMENKKRKAGQFLTAWMARSLIHPVGTKAASKLKSTAQNPTGNPYLQEAIDKGIL